MNLSVIVLIAGQLAGTDVADFHQVSAQALAQAQEGKFETALSIAKAGLTQCPPQDAGQTCQALLNYSLGFILQKRAETSKGEEQRADVMAAIDLYQESLKADPANGPVRFNLALLL